MRSLTAQKYSQALYQALSEVRTTRQQPLILDNFVRVVFEHRDRKKIPAIFRALEHIFQKQGKFFNIEMTTRFPFSVAQQKSFHSALTKAFEGEVEVRFFTDPSLCGGARLKVNDVVYDGSLKHMIDSLSQKFHS